MKIVLVAAEYSWPNYGGGIKTYTQTLANCLVQLGHSVHVITSDLGGEECHYSENGVFVHCVGPRHLVSWIGNRRPTSQSTGSLGGGQGSRLMDAAYYLARSVRIRKEVFRLVDSGEAEIVQVADFGAEGYALVQLPIVPVVAVLHATTFLLDRINGVRPTLGARVIQQLEKGAIIRANAIVAPSSTMRTIVAQEYHSRSLLNRIVVVPNPIDVAQFGAAFTQSSQVEGYALTVTYVGRLQPGKGVNVFAAAVPIIKGACPDVNFKFVGNDGLDSTTGNSMRAALSAQLQQYHSSINFTGPVPHEALAVHYHRSGVVVVPSLQETYGYTCAEAMACGACVVASRVGGLAELVEDGETGLLVPPNDPEALAQTVIRLLRNPAERQRLGANACAFVLANLSGERIADRMLELYKRVLA